MSELPNLLLRKEILKRLRLIFPEGTPHRAYCIRELSASTLFVMLYIGATEGSDVYLSPKHVYKMTGKQAKQVDEESRKKYAEEVLIPGREIRGDRWYADNTRESIRDETLREGFMQVGAVISKKDVATTSSKGRYLLKKQFAELFNPDLSNEELKLLIVEWQKNNLSTGALARIALLKGAGLDNEEGVLVQFPNKETRKLSAGLSSVLSKAVIEEFATKFFEKPVVLWLSESGNKVVARDDQLAKKIGIEIDASVDLPDIILVDLNSSTILIVFVEIVATDGAITNRRKEALYKITDAAGFKRSEVMFVTVFQDKNSQAFKKAFENVTSNSLIWFSSEPNNVFILKEGAIKLSKLKTILE
jgi:hypothetical protein